MKKNLSKVALLSFFLFVIFQFNAYAGIISFEGLSSATVIPNGYAGFNWSNFNALSSPTFNANVTPSGNTYAYINLSPSDEPPPFFGVTSVLPNQIFDFNSSYMSANWGSNLKVTAKGYLDGIETYSDAVFLGYRNPQQFSFSYTGIDELKFFVSPGDQSGFIKMGDPFYSQQVYAFSMDDLNVTGPSNVPIPAAVWLLGTGIVGLAALRKKVQK